ncbi:FKBP-type peptidyl-prolyl cis-trans isomerase [Tamlana sp. s12]|uniref:FKBP-type peptidyl-prolyl cis-trans isomerase n=1 Tax=Tamlana sp. s12 TaxID=1630406 RepID=UPI000800BFD5|nr:FKBP-type peptidyl-prolyl cis-trans isomerase [Tamlana sp. s12]OBQ52212.1 peptidylprolyl isomerase [Tamlana sp. s12]QQY82320.1 FKBP-type peptidyl-prolyl cis-trans isomerase [Tamlana sp. s12]
MKIMKCLSLLTLVLLVVSCNNQSSVSNKPIKTELDSVSYAIGMDVAKNVKMSFDDFDNELFVQGFTNVLDSTNILLDEATAQKVVRAFFQKKQQEEAAKRVEEGEKNKEEGVAFLESNKSKEGVQTTASGLQYIVLKEGTGAKPTKDSKVKVHYHGTLIDGTVFDSSVDRGEPTEFGVTQVIKGWTEGLQLMSEGAKYKFFIPQELAYGANPRPGGPIKPYATLIFDVELLEVK